MMGFCPIGLTDNGGGVISVGEMACAVNILEKV